MTVREDLPFTLEILARGVLDNLLEGCQVISPDFRYLYVNPAVAAQGRTTVDALVGRTMMEMYPGIENTEMFSILRRCMETREPAYLENEFTFPDGATGWFELRFEAAPEGVVILSIDITERKRGEIALRRTHRALTALSECNQTLVRATDEQSFMNDLCRLIIDKGGYRMAWIGMINGGEDAGTIFPAARAGHDAGYIDVVRRSWGESASAYPPCARAIRENKTVIARFIETEPGYAPWRDVALARGYASSIALPVRVGGETIGVLCIYAAEADAFDDHELELLEELALDLGYGIQTLRGRDAHERAQAALSRSQVRFQELVNDLDDIVYSIDTAGHLQYASPAIERIFGYPRESVVGRHFAEFVHPDDLPGLARHFEATLAGAVAAHEFRGIDADGRIRHLRSKGKVRMNGDRPAGVNGVVSDITEQRVTEEQLRLSQRLEAVGRLAGGIAHDFNNLLSVIVNYSVFAIEQLRAGDPVRADIEEILKSAERAAKLTTQLLAFSRKQVMAPEVLNLNTVVEGVEGMLRRILGEDIDIVARLAADLGNVEADPGQIEQVLMNLAVNSRDAMPAGGKLTIETANVEFDDSYADRHVSVRPGSFVMLAVTDTGTGMDIETQSHIFEPFFTTKTDGKGTGLGLAMVYGIVKQSGGNIWVYSEPDCGATFKVYLPRVEKTTSPVKRRLSQASVIPGTETVLVVEDEEGVRRLVERILSNAGYQVLSASNGGEALLLCEKHGTPIDLLLTDVVMPRMSGRELETRLASIRPGLKALYMSGYTDGAIAHHESLEPGTHFIGKPFTAAALTRKLREVLDDGR
ncbi:PAS domain-containing protein [bacterium]|nr:PAS domain-containing protein [bacterium]